MKLSSADFAALNRLLDQALDLPEAERAAWLAALPDGDRHLEALLTHLLAHPNEPVVPTRPDLLDALPAYMAQLAGPAGPGAEASRGTVGPYRLLRHIGQGGMGEVWLAERLDAAPRRQVALKLPLARVPSGKMAPRFARERDILARLEHPHIARLYDAGVSTEGQPYLAMQYVEGLPITRHADDARLGVRDRVRLFLQVLQAVQYAHGHLVIHRDLKPSNILVTGSGEVQLLDFGIAALLRDADSADPGAPLTETGAAPLTPGYAAPEQILGQPISTGSDVYSLGVVLYELLAGRRPFRPATDSRAALEQAILTLDPPRPSQVAQDARRQLRGELDTIVLAALQKDPARRYLSAEAFENDLRNWLSGAPVQAHPDSLPYRMRKFAWRHRLMVAAAASTTLALVIGLGVALQQARLAREQAVAAQQAASRAQAVQEFLVGLFDAADPAQTQGRDVGVRELLARGERDLAGKLREQPQTRIALSGALVEIFYKLGDAQHGLTLAEAWRDLALKTQGPASVDYADAIRMLGLIHSELEHHEEALRLLQQADGLLKPFAAERQAAVLDLPGTIALELTTLGRNAEAAALLERAIPALAAHYGPDHWLVIQEKANLAATYAKDGDAAKAMAIYAALEPLLEQPRPEQGLDVPALRESIGFAQWHAGQWPQALASLTRAIDEAAQLAGPNNSMSIPAERTRAMVYYDMGAYAQASQAMQAAARHAESVYPKGDSAIALVRALCILPLVRAGHAADAAAIAQEVNHLGADAGTSDEIDRVNFRRWAAVAMIYDGKPAQALAELDAVAAQEQSSGDSPEHRAITLNYRAGALNALNRSAPAAAAAEQALQLTRARKPSSAQRLAMGTQLLTLAVAQVRQHAFDRAEAAIDQARQALATDLPAGHAMFQTLAAVRADLLREQGHVREAAAALAEARQRYREASGAEMPSAWPLVF